MFPSSSAIVGADYKPEREMFIGVFLVCFGNGFIFSTNLTLVRPVFKFFLVDSLSFHSFQTSKVYFSFTLYIFIQSNEIDKIKL